MKYNKINNIPPELVFVDDTKKNKILRQSRRDIAVISSFLFWELGCSINRIEKLESKY